MKNYNSSPNAQSVNIRCPECRKNGVFHGVHNVQDALFSETHLRSGAGQNLTVYTYGIRVCPNPECQEPLLVILDGLNKLRRAYPAERLDFEPTNVPPKILANFEEALNCHANECFRAAAIMVRRTLEEICAERNATGNNLKARVAALANKIVVPKELLEAADELRLLGNDAAHLEAQVYDDIGKEEVEAAIDLTKEILKAVYQLSSLVNRLRALKKSQ